MAWTILFVAGIMEIGWAIGLKYTEGFTRLVPSVLTLACMAGSIILLGLAVKTLPIGTAYAVWTGIGAVGTALLGIALFGDPATALRLACIGVSLVMRKPMVRTMRQPPISVPIPCASRPSACPSPSPPGRRSPPRTGC